MEILFQLCLVTCISLFITKIAKVVESLYVVHLFCSNGLFPTYLSLLFSRKTEKVCIGLKDLCPLLIMISIGMLWLVAVQKSLIVVENSPTYPSLVHKEELTTIRSYPDDNSGMQIQLNLLVLQWKATSTKKERILKG